MSNLQEFNKLSPIKLNDNMFQRVGKDWMLITVDDKKSANPMTASWGGVGHLWNFDVTFAFVRHSRYTFELLEKSDYYSLCFFPNGYKKELAFCGKVSGRNVDKAKEAGLTLKYIKLEDGAKVPYWQESNLVLVCKKIYYSDILDGTFLDPSILEHYKDNDYHRLYVGKIEEVLQK